MWNGAADWLTYPLSKSQDSLKGHNKDSTYSDKEAKLLVTCYDFLKICIKVSKHRIPSIMCSFLNYGFARSCGIIDLPLLDDHRLADILEHPRFDIELLHSPFILLLPLLE